MAIRLMAARKLHELYSALPDCEERTVLMHYIDHLENTARDFHLQARHIAESVGGSIPAREDYEPS